MPFSERLKLLLKRGSLPLKSDADLPLWNELIAAFEANPVNALAEVKALEQNANYSFFFDTVTVNGVSFTPSLDDFGEFAGAMHAALMRDFDTYNRKGDTRVHALVRRVRALAAKHDLIPESEVELLPVHPKHKMGTGLVTTDLLTFLPDLNASGPGGFGSQPDQAIIGAAAPMWNLLKQRRQVKQSNGAIGRSTHYVLAHLLNHQVNGSGARLANVVPFAADGNKQMAKQVEVHLKQLVQMGIPVQYTIDLGAAVGMTPGRAAARAACTTQLQRDIIDAEQHLPSSITVSLSALQEDGTMISILSGYVIPNFVPETVPVT